ncbi:MAG TPA: succinyl-diaminopimelate desuccinylase [Candidatus Stackebrandtia faecavium]|nr:succinyl-diaminopimelate desuccinylase [Candidatus Stackebrandtia faecavium]
MVSLTNEQLNDPVALTRALVDMESVSGDEEQIADLVESALRDRAHLRVLRDGNVVFARTELGRDKRILLAGHLDTVPLNDNFPSHTDGDTMYGCGTSDMKSGTAIALHLAATLSDPACDLSFVFYDCEEVDSERNGLNKASIHRPEWLAADFAFLLEPTLGVVEAGCQGTMRANITLTGKRAHSARSWLGDNAIHSAGEVLRRLDDYSARTVDIDGCRYREGLNAVGIAGGVAGNVIPDTCTVTVNFRFAPDRSLDDAQRHLEEVFAGFQIEVTDRGPAAMPGLQAPAAAQFLRRIGHEPRAKLGWTDVARFAQLGVPAVNFGPGDPNLAHTKNEHVSCSRIVDCCETLRDYLAKGSQ